MIQTINLHDFRQAFHNMGRGEQFSYEALELIYDFFEENSPDSELDVIAICCEFEEMSIEQIIRNYSIDCDEVEDDEIFSHVMDYLEEHTSVIGQIDEDSIVFIQF